MTTKQIGQLVYQKRKAGGLSMREASAQLGLCIDTISRLERAMHTPDVTSLAKLSAWLGLPVSHLMSEAAELAVVKSDEPLPVVVERILKQDCNLSPEAAESLSKIFRVSYQEAVKLSAQRQ